MLHDDQHYHDKPSNIVSAPTPFSIISPEWKTFHRLITLSCYIFQPGTVLFISFNDAKLKWIGETG